MNMWKPNLGGWLTIINCATWLLITLADRSGVISYGSIPFACRVILACLIGSMSLPIAWVFMLPTLDGPLSNDQIAFRYFMVGANSFLWGYSVAWIVKLIGRAFKHFASATKRPVAQQN